MEFYEGQLFGFWKILDPTPQFDVYKHANFKCLCTNCNKTISYIYRSRLLNKKYYNQCIRCSKNLDELVGYSQCQKRYFIQLKSSAKTRKIPFSIKIKDIYKLLVKQDFKCSLSDVPIDIDGKKNTASIDRIDSGKGYTKKNVQWVHVDINRAKGAMSQLEFIELCKKVVAKN